MVRACGKQQPRERVPQELIAFTVGPAMAVDLLGAEQRVRLALALELDAPRVFYPCPDRLGGLASRGRDELRLPRRRHFELDVDPVGERPGDAAAIASDALGRAPAASA